MSEYKVFGDNAGETGNDIRELLSSGGVPYKIMKSVRDYKASMDTHLQAICGYLQTSGIEYDYGLEANYAAFQAKGGSDESEFGKALLHSHLDYLEYNLGQFTSADPSFAEAFMASFTGKKILVRPAADASSFQGGCRSRFTAGGELLIEYKVFGDNAGETGNDIRELF